MAAHRATVTPHRLALIWSDRQWTYAELDAEVDAWRAGWPRSASVDGSRVATLLHNSQHVPFIVHAMSRIGATLVPLNVRLRP